jgi:hypothetical protein
MNRYYLGYQDQDFIDMRVLYEPSFAERMKRRTNPNTFRIRGETCSYVDKIENYFLQVTGKSRPLVVLDYGGGVGSNTPFGSLANVAIVDIDTSYVEVNNPVPSGNPDLVCLINVLEHVNNPTDILITALRSCRKVVDVLIEVPLERFMHDLSIEVSYKSKKIWTEHINCFTSMGLMCLAKNAGLVPYEVRPLILQTTVISDNFAEENSIAMILACRYDPEGYQ